MAKKKKAKVDFFAQVQGVVDSVEDLSAGDFHKLKWGQNWFFLLRTDDVDFVIHRARHGIHICPAALDGKECYGCKRVRAETKKGNKDFAGEWRLKPTGYFNAIRKDKLKKGSADDVKILQVSTGVLRDILVDVMEGKFDPTTLEEARPLCINKRHTHTTYKVAYTVSWGDDRDVSKYITDDLLVGVRDLAEHEYTQASTSKEIKDAMAGKTGGKQQGSKRGSKVKDEELDDSEDEFEDEKLDDDVKDVADDEENDFDDDLDVEDADDDLDGELKDDDGEEEDTVFDDEPGDLDDELSEDEEAALLAEPEEKPKPKQKPKAKADVDPDAEPAPKKTRKRKVKKAATTEE